ncbi:MAG: helix-turn-helix transcriptional regulator [Opitutales bacterium]|nr:helix-turn-helix transcriptional regulator [Opitutales bacterium]
MAFQSKVLWAFEQQIKSQYYRYDNVKRGRNRTHVIQLVLDGQILFQDKKGTRAVHKNQMVLFKHQEPTKYWHPEGDDEGFHTQFVEFEDAPCTEIFNSIRNNHGSIIDVSPESNAAKLLTLLARSYVAEGTMDPYESSTALYGIMMDLHRQLHQVDPFKDPIALLYKRINDYYSEKISVSSCAQELNLSREHLSRIFSSRYGVSPKKLLQENRMNAARKLMLLRKHNISEIAEKCGYNDSNAFSRAYKNHFKEAPLIHRQSMYEAQEI